MEIAVDKSCPGSAHTDGDVNLWSSSPGCSAGSYLQLPRRDFPHSATLLCCCMYISNQTGLCQYTLSPVSQNRITTSHLLTPAETIMNFKAKVIWLHGYIFLKCVSHGIFLDFFFTETVETFSSSFFIKRRLHGHFKTCFLSNGQESQVK